MDINDFHAAMTDPTEPQFPAFAPQPGPVQFHAARLPEGATNVPAIELATATITGTHVVFVADPTAVHLIELLYGLLDPDAQRILSARLYRAASGIVLPGSEGL